MSSLAATSDNPNGGGVSRPGGPVIPLLRIFALAVVAITFSYLLNNYLDFWRGWPGAGNSYDLYGLIQLAIYLVAVAVVVIYVSRTPECSMHADAERLSALTAYIVRSVFWATLFIGLADMVLSFLRVEGLLGDVVGHDLAQDLSQPRPRGLYVHYPLIALGFAIGLVVRSLGFYWLAYLVVVAEIEIVIARFIFSYEQAFMADLVRFWYGALFLFASAYTLVEEGHVRVDILYSGFSERGKAWTNALGSLLLGLPLCWVIIAMGTWGRSDMINGPLINFEVTQQGYGMYVKYLLAGFLLIFALTMLIQFMSYLLSSAAVLLREKGWHPDFREHTQI